VVRVIWKSVQLGVTALAVTSLLFFGVGPHLCNYRTLTMLSGSMTPSFPTGSELIDTSIPASELRVGDVLTYHIPVFDHHVESHRIISIKPDPDGGYLIRTKGDHNNAPDPWTADITARRVWIARVDLPDVGYVIRALRSPITLHLLQWVVPGILLLWLLRGVWMAENGVTEIVLDDVQDNEYVNDEPPADEAPDPAPLAYFPNVPARPWRPDDSIAEPLVAATPRVDTRRWIAPIVLLVCVPLGLWSRSALKTDAAKP
jgi:signal peptidase I